MFLLTWHVLRALAGGASRDDRQGSRNATPRSWPLRRLHHDRNRVCPGRVLPVRAHAVGAVEKVCDDGLHDVGALE